ncbi:MCE family protein [Pseudonocardia sp. KRD-184]|uniref:MCE family protein n=1 Tax=Pseudonocardia oceani TaxID=2792013 RepID=A0ABS6U6Z8_9PSEU|nr:MlaD family protein [Pseudonocardia oceani]MBW0090839.1 MCE family protein [Pseudonocardia oceani]MBW0094569.1 MCE family protein [Pseudonocardia oceani]MBW0107370.1 MCE family protein [Pseudonocardia oceani]MBW0120530.1 MCE family protein [Pseudonocardia oceani]MBW0128007.1 MCE family protein [Pseudonocardia oceani]
MITRATKVQLVAFLLLTVLGVGYTGFRYAGFGDVFGTTTYPVTMQLADSGGIFTGADVTYRGVSVGRVGPLTLTPQGVDVQLDLQRSAPAIPLDVDAAVRNLSAIGEQYVDLQPASDGGPSLEDGSVVPVDRTSIPVPVEDLVVGVDDLARSVPLESLRTVVSELGTAFEGTAGPLQKILATTDAFSEDAVEALPQTLDLLRDGRTVLTTQNETAGSFQNFSADLALLAEQLRTSDPDLRRLLETAPEASEQITGLLRESGPGLSVLLSDLLTVARVAEPRQEALRQLLVTYPAFASVAYTVAPGDGTAHLGLVVNVFDPFPCTRGYEGTVRRSGTDIADTPANQDAYCAEPPGSPISVRGAQNAPRAETPMAPAGAPSGPPAGGLPAGSAPVGSPTPLSSPAQILTGLLP